MIKHTNGFTLIEVMIAVAIIGVVLTALSSLEISLMKTTTRTSRRFNTVWAMSFFLNEAHLKFHDKDKETKTIKEPAMTLTFERIPAPKESSLASCKDLKIERVQAHYKTLAGSKQDTMITFKYKPKGQNEAGV